MQKPPDTEAQIYAILPWHDHIVNFKVAMSVSAILLEHAVIRSVAGYLKKANVNLLTSQRFR